MVTAVKGWAGKGDSYWVVRVGKKIFQSPASTLKIKFQVSSVAFMAVHYAALTPSFSLLFKFSMSLHVLGLCMYFSCRLECPSTFLPHHQLLLICQGSA